MASQLRYGVLPVMSIISRRLLSVSAVNSVKKITEKTVGNVTTVELEPVSQDPRPKLSKAPDRCSLCTCDIPPKIRYTDVLILEQFMREDGTVLPKELTGLCSKQQLRVERCVMQAHWSGLFPDRTLPNFDRAGYKRFNRHWDDDMDMYRTSIKRKPGIWFYVQRYGPPRKVAIREKQQQ